MTDDRSEDPFAFLERAEVHVVRDDASPRVAASFADLGPERIVGRWCLKTVLGSGGFGVVYEASPESGLGEPVAIKFATPAGGEILERRFVQEASVAAGLDHPNVVRAFERGALADGSRYLVMELVEGETLRERLAGRSGVSPPELVAIVRGLGDGLEALHRVGVVHRDVKPSNVMLASPLVDGDGVTIIDLGLCKGSLALTASQQRVGTVAYMAPEVLSGGARMASVAADIYGLALTAYEAATGEPAFEAPSLAALVGKIHRGVTDAVKGNLRAHCSEAFVQQVAQGMGPAAARPASAQAYGRALAAAVTSG